MEDEIKFNAKKRQYKEFFQSSIVYFDMQNSNEKRFMEREMKDLFGTRVETFLCNRVTLVITDSKQTAKENVKAAKNVSAKVVAVSMVRHYLAKYFDRPENLTGVLLQQQQHQQGRLNSTLIKGRVSDKPEFIEFKNPFILLYDIEEWHKPIHKEYSETITLEGQKRAHPYLVQLPFVGLSFKAPAQPGGSPFYHNYSKLPFHLPNASRQSLLLSAEQSKHEQLLCIYQPLITPFDQKDQESRVKMMKLVELKAKAAAEHLRSKNTQSCKYPRYPYAPAPKQSQQQQPQKAVEGFCECCFKKYQNLKEHLMSVEHQNFVKNDANFKELDLILESKSCRRNLRKSHVPEIKIDGDLSEGGLKRLYGRGWKYASSSLGQMEQLKFRRDLVRILGTRVEIRNREQIFDLVDLNLGESVRQMRQMARYCGNKTFPNEFENEFYAMINSSDPCRYGSWMNQGLTSAETSESSLSVSSGSGFKTPIKRKLITSTSDGSENDDDDDEEEVFIVKKTKINNTIFDDIIDGSTLSSVPETPPLSISESVKTKSRKVINKKLY